MANIKQIQTLLEQDMTRKEFIVHMGIACAALFGIHKIIDSLTGTSKNTTSDNFGAYGVQSYSGIPSNNSMKQGTL